MDIRSFFRKNKGISGVYKITNTVTDEFYVGASGDVGNRWRQHLCYGNREDTGWQTDIKKYGVENFSFQILEEVPKEDLQAREKYWIEGLKPTYNKYSGGGGKPGNSYKKGIPLSPEHRAKMVEINRKKALDPEYIKRLSEAHKGLRPSKETRERMSNSQRGRTITWGNKISQSKKGVPLPKFKFLLPSGEIKEMTSQIASREYTRKGIEVVKLI